MADAAPLVVLDDCRIAVASGSPVALDLTQTQWSGSASEVLGVLLDDHLLPLGKWCTELTHNSPAKPAWEHRRLHGARRAASISNQSDP